jgi:Na+-driven multidrug efflux pump
VYRLFCQYVLHYCHTPQWLTVVTEQNSWSIGSQTRIGNLVGAGKAMKARAVTFITLIFAITWMLSHAAIMFFFPEQLVSVYTTDQGTLRS